MDQKDDMKIPGNESKQDFRLDQEDKQETQVSSWKTFIIHCFVISASILLNDVSGEYTRTPIISDELNWYGIA